MTQMVIFWLGIFYLLGKYDVRDVITVLNERKHLKMVSRERLNVLPKPSGLSGTQSCYLAHFMLMPPLRVAEQQVRWQIQAAP